MPPVAGVFAAVSAYVSGIYAAFQVSAVGTWIAANSFLARLIGSIVLSVGIPLVQSFFSRKSEGASTESAKVNVRISEPLRWLAAGVTRQGGAVIFAEFDSLGNLWYVVVHADSIMNAKVAYYFDDVEVTVDTNGFVQTDLFCLNDKLEPYTGTGTKVPYFQLWTTTFTETNPTPPAITALQAAFPGVWTSDHKLVGTTYTAIKVTALKINDRYKIYKWRGALGLGEPAVALVARWSNAYDPRDVEQTNGTPSTYRYSEANPVLIWAWFRTHRYGRNKPRNQINWTRVAEQAAICDQMVNSLTGLRRRYQCGIAIPENKERVVAEQEILMTMDAQLVFDDDGACWPRVGHYSAPSLTLTRNRDIVAMESVEAQDGESETQGVIVRYTSPEAEYSAQPSAPWLNPLYHVPGEAATFLTVDILGCQNHAQAMTLAKAIGMRSQSAYKLLPTVGLRGLRARQERIVSLQYDNVFFGDHEIVTPVEVDPNGMFCGFGVVPVDQDRWTLLSGEELPAPVIDVTTTTSAPSAPAGVVLSHANGRIQATFSAPARQDVTYEFQYIKTADIAGEQWLDMTVQMSALLAFSGTVVDGISYSVRQRAVTSSGTPIAWSTPVTITAPVEPVTQVTVTSSLDSAVISWRNPLGSGFAHTKVFRGTTNVFAAATEIAGPIVGGLGQVQQITNNIPAGTYYWWVVAYNASGTASVPVGPAAALVGIVDFSSGTLPASVAFTRGSTGRWYDGSGVRQSAAIDVPRFDRNRLTPFALRGLLVEPAATNLHTNSDDMTGYTLTNLTNTTDGTKQSDGVTDMRKLTVVATTNTLAVRAFAGAGSASGNTVSFEVRKGSSATTTNRFHLLNNTTSVGLIDCSVNLDTGAVTYNAFGTITGTVTVELLANGNRLVTMSAATGINAGNTLSLYTGFLGATQTAGQHVYVGALQIEAGPSRTSYIPATGSSASRSADAVVIDWAARGVANGNITVRYTFDNDTTQDVLTTVAGGTAPIPTNLARSWIKKAERVL